MADVNDLETIFASVSIPIVLRGALKGWSPCEWSMQQFATVFADRKLPFRIASRITADGDPTWESKCAVVEARVQDFLDWIGTAVDDKEPEAKKANYEDSVSKKSFGNDKKLTDNPFSALNQQDHFAYASYLYLRDLFENDEETLRLFNWTMLGLPNRNGQHSTMWLGSAGANTPCHRDAYGWNAVAQVHGTKRWTLFAPNDSGSLYPTRVPFEETSTYSQVNIANPDLSRFPRFADVRPFCTDLRAGDVLIVPARWWHFVESLDTPTLSVNTWTELPSLDNMQRCNEAIAKFAVNTILHSCSGMFADSDQSENDVDSENTSEVASAADVNSKLDVETILNPNEQIESVETLLSYIRSAFAQSGGAPLQPVLHSGNDKQEEQHVSKDKHTAAQSLTGVISDGMEQLKKRYSVELLESSNFSDWYTSISSRRDHSSTGTNQMQTFVSESAHKSLADSYQDHDLIADLVFAFTHESVVERIRDLIYERRNMRSSNF